MIRTIARATAWRARRLLQGGPRPAILMYHRIARETFDPWGLAVSPSAFAEQIEWLAAHRQVLPLVEFAEMHRAANLPSNAVALTFDDAYDCTAEVAAPLLKSARLPATIFVPAELIERGMPFWWDELQALVLDHEGDRLALGNEDVVLGDKQVDDGCWPPGAPPRTPRQAAFQRIWALLREKSPAELDGAMAELRTQARGGRQRAIPAPMSPERIRETASDLIEFGSHALTHPWLTSLSAVEKQREIGDSIGAVERLAGRRPASFAYPYGNLDAESERIVEEAGFACACATVGHGVGPKSRTFALPRVQVGNWSSRDLARALAAA